MRTNRNVVSIDWLQILCTKRDNRVDTNLFFTSDQTNEHGMHNTYKLVDAKEFTMGYNYHKSVMLKDIVVAHISWCPKRENVDENNCSIKIANNVLYTNMWHFILGDVCNALGWQVKSITRIDIACDMNYLMHGLHPELFIRKYIKGNCNGYIRCGSNKFSVIGEKYLQNTSMSYIRWGSRSSGVCTYLYNKSKEMRECSMKPWIIERWRGAGLNVKNVWRLEFSINSAGRGLKDIENGLIHSLFVDDIQTQSQLISIFQTYAKKYFHFKHLRKNGTKYVKDMKDAELVDTTQSTELIPCQLYNRVHTSNQIQNAIVQIQYIKDELHEKNEQRNNGVENAIDKVVFMLNQKLFEQRKADDLREKITSSLQNGLIRHTNNITYAQRVLNTNSFINENNYKEEICSRTANRIVQLLLSRKNSKLLAYPA